MAYHTTQKTILRKQARRSRFLAEAIRLFSLGGFHQTTVPMIVAAAESSNGAFYLDFKNKEDIFAAALELIGQQMSQAVSQSMAGAGSNTLTHMEAAVRGLVHFLVTNEHEARMLIVESSGLSQRIEAIRRQIVQSHTRSVEMALTLLKDRLPPIEPAVAATCWVGAVYESAFRWLEQKPEERIPPQRLADAVATFNLRAIGAFGVIGPG